MARGAELEFRFSRYSIRLISASEIVMDTMFRLVTSTFDVPPHLSVVPRVRRRVMDRVLAQGFLVEPETVYTVGLVVTELITNAVVHAGASTPSIRITLETGDGGRLRLGVRDNRTAFPRQVAPSADATCGRGTAIVSALLHELGGRLTVERHRGGKTVWAEVPGDAAGCSGEPLL
ncbi:ATP-binding protein [Embleya sp. NPDC020886]|uniref:ATP-binding protein n=1 Tax=Embleya sp. NPDC020886 TaxID=3363980 RepID=UPI0037AF7C68